MEKPTCTVRILLVACLTILACSEKDDTRAIHDLIDTGKTLAEAHDLPGLIGLTTEDVRAMPMQLSRSGLKGVLWRAFKYYGQFTVYYPDPTIDLQENGGSATARFPFLILKTNHEMPALEKLRDDPKAWVEAIGETADLYRLHLDLIRQGDRWRVKQVVLERFTGTGFR